MFNDYKLPSGGQYISKSKKYCNQESAKNIGKHLRANSISKTDCTIN